MHLKMVNFMLSELSLFFFKGKILHQYPNTYIWHRGENILIFKKHLFSHTSWRT